MGFSYSTETRGEVCLGIALESGLHHMPFVLWEATWGTVWFQITAKKVHFRWSLGQRQLNCHASDIERVFKHDFTKNVGTQKRNQMFLNYLVLGLQMQYLICLWAFRYFHATTGYIQITWFSEDLRWRFLQFHCAYTLCKISDSGFVVRWHSQRGVQGCGEAFWSHFHQQRLNQHRKLDRASTKVSVRRDVLYIMCQPQLGQG